MLSRIFNIIRRDGFKNLFDKALRRLQVGSLKKHMKKKDWKRAAKNGEWLVNRYPKEINFYHKLARCYKENNNHDLATITLQEGLKKHLDLDETIDYIENIISPTGEVQTEYIYLGGEQNMGFFEHRLGKKKLITKICNTSSENESVFYSQICEAQPRLKDFTPSIVNVFEIGQGIKLVTMEKIEGDIPCLEVNILNKVININRVITSINYSQLKTWCRLPEYGKEFRWKNNMTLASNLVKAMQTFSTIYDEKTNIVFFDFMCARMKALNYSSESRKLISRLESIIITNQLYKNIDPELHFSLQHGDFYLHNMLVDNKCGRLYVIDWGLFGISLRGIDMAGFIGRSKLPFKQAQSIYLFDSAANNSLSYVEKIFFVYALIVIWFIYLYQDEFDNQLEIYLYPAIEYLEYTFSEVT